MRYPMQTKGEEGAGLVALSLDPLQVAPRRFTATIHYVGGKLRKAYRLPTDGRFGAGGIAGDGGVLVEMEIEVQPKGAPRCLGLAVKPEPPENTPITATALRRVTIDKLMRQAVADAVVEIGLELPDGERWAIAPGLEERDDFYERYREGARRPRRGVPLTEDDLVRVANIYRDALADIRHRHRPTAMVAKVEGVSRATAARRVSLARERGHLGPAKPGHAGG